MINARLSKSTLTILFNLVCAQTAWAHVEGGQAAGFITGLQHPWSGLDHVLAMIAVGLWGAQLGSPALWLLPIAFPMMMAMGAMMGLMGIPVPGVEIGIALSAIVLGMMIFVEVRPKLAVAVAMVGIFAIFHGHAHGTELPEGQSGLLYSMGFVIATGCLHGVGIAIGLVNDLPAGKLVLRGAGSFIAAMGVFFLWKAMM
jgi:urease accessory protein